MQYMPFIAPNRLRCSDTAGYQMCLKYQINPIQIWSNVHDNDPLRRHRITETVDVIAFLFMIMFENESVRLRHHLFVDTYDT